MKDEVLSFKNLFLIGLVVMAALLLVDGFLKYQKVRQQPGQSRGGYTSPGVYSGASYAAPANNGTPVYYSVQAPATTATNQVSTNNVVTDSSNLAPDGGFGQ